MTIGGWIVNAGGLEIGPGALRILKASGIFTWRGKRSLAAGDRLFTRFGGRVAPIALMLNGGPLRSPHTFDRFPIILSDDMIPAAADRGGSCRNDQPDSGIPPAVLERGF